MTILRRKNIRTRQPQQHVRVEAQNPYDFAWVWNPIQSNTAAIGSGLFQNKFESIKQYESGKRYTGLDLKLTTLKSDTSSRSDLGLMVGARPDSIPTTFELNLDPAGTFLPGGHDWSFITIRHFHTSGDTSIMGWETEGGFLIWADTIAGALRLCIFDGGVECGPAAELDEDRPYVIVITHDNATSTLRTYVDGVASAVDTGFSPSGASKLSLTHQNGAKWADQTIFLAGLSNSTWNVSQVETLSENPWQIFEPSTNVIPFPGPVAVGGARPQNPLGHPLKGAFGGPIG